MRFTDVRNICDKTEWKGLEKMKKGLIQITVSP